MKRFLMSVMLMSIAGDSIGAIHEKEMPGTGKTDMQMMKDCPMALPGTSLAASDTAGGIAITFTTRADNVLELRRRVEHMAAMHTGEPRHEGMMNRHMLPGTVSYEPIENGARLTLTPKDPERLAEFRDQVRAHVAQMSKGECSMMEQMMGNMGAPKAEPKIEPKKDDIDHSAHHPERD
jgi:hypothetical protein